MTFLENRYLADLLTELWCFNTQRNRGHLLEHHFFTLLDIIPIYIRDHNTSNCLLPNWL